MKQTLVPKPDIKLQTKFHKGKQESLNILTYSNDELKRYLQEQMNENPYLHIFSSTSLESDADAYLEYDHSKRSLYDEIMEQVHLYRGNMDESICEYLLSQLDSNGYFRISRNALFQDAPYTKEAILYHLEILHTFEPFGVFAFDLKDCLQIQCKNMEDANATIAYELCCHLEELALKRWDSIQDTTGFTFKEVQAGFHTIQKCNPKPAANYNVEVIYVNPEFKIEVIAQAIHIQLLNDDLSLSFQLDETMDESKELSKYMREQRTFIKHLQTSIQKRNMTLLQIMQYICEIQKDFFLHTGPLKHLTLAMLAQTCGLHISTISRAIMNKSFEFENQYIPLKKMLVSGGNKDMVQEEIKHKIQDIIQHENKKHPLSDEEIRKLLESENIRISRRAISKYREACFIFNSSKRKIK